MPFTRISLIKGKSREYLQAVSDSLHAALVEAFEVPPADRFQAIQQFEPHELIFDTHYLGGPRSNNYLLFQISAGRQRDAATKRAFFKCLVDKLAVSPGVRKEDVMIIIQTTDTDDWSFADGLPMPTVALPVNRATPTIQPERTAT
jgi:phenylpyruvate tautomerase PptA (4-oxalocrotonate tautomerase family)